VTQTKEVEMMKAIVLTASAMVLASLFTAFAASDADIIKNAEIAGPADVASNSKVYGFGEDGKMKVVHEGSKGDWCIPVEANYCGHGHYPPGRIT
jgi:hypothetical protein